MYKKVCLKCNKSFSCKKENRKFCSRSCSNKVRKEITKEHKEKISNTLKKKFRKNNNLKCLNCNKEYYRKPSKVKGSKFCSKSCTTTYRNKKGLARKAGLKSVSVQSETKRSKNEIHFYNLCSKKYKNVLNNKPIFNGWDADIIIEDLKIAILWNGKWHYEKIKSNHSVKQVQNRDKIKIKEIRKKGYIPYIIKDMGKEDKVFVENKFEEFLRNNKKSS